MRIDPPKNKNKGLELEQFHMPHVNQKGLVLKKTNKKLELERSHMPHVDQKRANSSNFLACHW